MTNIKPWVTGGMIDEFDELTIGLGPDALSLLPYILMRRSRDFRKVASEQTVLFGEEIPNLAFAEIEKQPRHIASPQTVEVNVFTAEIKVQRHDHELLEIQFGIIIPIIEKRKAFLVYKLK